MKVNIEITRSQVELVYSTYNNAQIFARDTNINRKIFNALTSSKLELISSMAGLLPSSPFLSESSTSATLSTLDLTPFTWNPSSQKLFTSRLLRSHLDLHSWGLTWYHRFWRHGEGRWDSVPMVAGAGHSHWCCCGCCCCCCCCCDSVHKSAVKHRLVHTGECHLERQVLHSHAVCQPLNKF